MPEFHGPSPDAGASAERLADHEARLHPRFAAQRAARQDQELDDVPVDMLKDPEATRAAIRRRRARRA